ncbi:MAG: adenylyl-sulfate kinase [Oscillatoriales cyanobacterium SM2_1_8]|nr:adenylyl-sulfate kinase [Oscillatoriales cyanobacterium SM2_1_8]
MDGTALNEAVGGIVWLTGLSGAGKTTIAQAVYATLRAQGRRVELLDGDVIRTNLSKGLGFSKEDRDTNVRRVGFVCHLLARNGVVAIAAVISPYQTVRQEVRALGSPFVEVYVQAPLAVCEQRDVKGLYRRARAGLIQGFTGIDDPYEPPLAPDVVCCTDRETVAESVGKVLAAMAACGLG